MYKLIYKFFFQKYFSLFVSNYLFIICYLTYNIIMSSSRVYRLMLGFCRCVMKEITSVGIKGGTSKWQRWIEGSNMLYLGVETLWVASKGVGKGPSSYWNVVSGWKLVVTWENGSGLSRANVAESWVMGAHWKVIGRGIFLPKEAKNSNFMIPNNFLRKISQSMKDHAFIYKFMGICPKEHEII